MSADILIIAAIAAYCIFVAARITKGTELYIRKVAPLGDPVEITVRGYELSVRKNDAQCVQVR